MQWHYGRADGPAVLKHQNEVCTSRKLCRYDDRFKKTKENLNLRETNEAAAIGNFVGHYILHLPENGVLPSFILVHSK